MLLSYETPLGLVDFTFHLNERRKVHAHSKYTDPKKFATSKANNRVVRNTVGRFYTNVCNELNVSLGNEDSQADVLRSIENPKLVQKFLMKIAEGGQKKRSVFMFLECLRKFQKFLVSCNVNEGTGAF